MPVARVLSSADPTATAGVAIALGQILVFDSSGDVILADSTFAANKWQVVYVARETVAPSNVLRVAEPGRLTPVLFSAPPPSSANGTKVYLSTVDGEAMLAPGPVSTGNVVMLVGTLQGADGATTIPNVLFQPQYLSRIP